MNQTINTKGMISRQKVMNLASKLWKAVKSGTEVQFIEKHYPTMSSQAKVVLVKRMQAQATTWGQSQSLAWKMAKYQIRKQTEYAKAILKDQEFKRSKGKVYTEYVPNTEPSPFFQRPKEDVIYTAAYGRVALTGWLKELLGV